MFDRKRLMIPDVIETPRLIIRTMQPADVTGLNAAYQSSLERLAPWFPWARKISPLLNTKL